MSSYNSSTDSSSLYTYSSARQQPQTASPPSSVQSTPSSSKSYYGCLIPGAPGQASLPLASASNYGLATPPDSPTNCRAPSLTIHPVLAFQHTFPISYNVLYPITHIQLREPFNSTTLLHSATHIPITQIYINLPHYPAWSFTVHNARGVTITDVLQKIQDSLHVAVGRAEWETHTHSVRDMALAAFNARCGTDKNARQVGMKRVDFLGPKIMFAGLSSSNQGSGRFDIHFI